MPDPASLTSTVLARGKRRCHRCHAALDASACVLDRIDPKRRDRPNALANLRPSCRRCHVLRCHPTHGLVNEGKVAAAVADGVIPADWRGLVWEG